MIIDGRIARGGKGFEKRMAKEKFSLFLLWMISRKAQHGYEIIKTLRDDPSMPDIAASRIYPILRALSRKGLISQRKVMQGKRARKVYYIMPKGKEILKKARDHIRKSPLLMAYVEDMLE